MTHFNQLFRKRIGLTNDSELSFHELPNILERTGKTIPFENLAISDNRVREITEEGLIDKILKRDEGGLCYELNPIFHMFLKANGFQSFLALGTVYIADQQIYSEPSGTHVVVLLEYDNQRYLIDTGFGANLPLLPVPFTGEPVHSSNGVFRVRKTKTEYGDHVMEMKIKHKHDDWQIGYAFDTTNVTADVTEMNVPQQLILSNSESRFNHGPLITKVTDRGNVTLTKTSWTQWEDGNMTKEEITPDRYRQLLTGQFGLKASDNNIRNRSDRYDV